MRLRISLHQILLPEYNANIHPSMAVTFVPQGVTTRGIDAENVSFAFTRSFLYILSSVSRFRSQKWIRELSQPQTQLTCRTFCSTTERYIDHLRTSKDRDENIVTAQLANRVKRALPDWSGLPRSVCLIFYLATKPNLATF